MLIGNGKVAIAVGVGRSSHGLDVIGQLGAFFNLEDFNFG